MIALIDCNSFFVSCEQVAHPELKNKPVVVFSNNNGCIISRSNEAKALGVKMGEAVFKYKHLFETGKVIGCSPSFSLYQKISKQVVQALRGFSPWVEPYSIDESFVRFGGTDQASVLGPGMRQAVLTQTGIPVSIGFGATKTLAKLASDKAKAMPGNIMDLGSYALSRVLNTIPVEEVWGIGYRTTRWLHRHGIETAGAFRDADPHWIRKKMGIGGGRIQRELNGQLCFPVGISVQMPSFYAQEAAQKSLLHSRSFPERITSIPGLQTALAENIKSACAKLRRANLCASEMGFFIKTSRFDSHYDSDAWTYRFPQATNNENEVLRVMKSKLPTLFKSGYRYAKSGVYFNGLIPDSAVQLSFFVNPREEKERALLGTLDHIRQRWGRQSIIRGSSLTSV